MYPDLLFYYDVNLADVIAGRGPSPFLVLLMVQRLPDTSMTIALASGGKSHLGWGVDRHLAADTFDALNQNTKATGNFKKPPKIEPYPRPNTKAVAEKPRTVAEAYRRITGRG